MRYNKLILPIVLALFVLPLTAGGSTAIAPSQPGAQGFKILLSDGSILKGAVSFTMSIDTQYGRLAVPSTNFVSANFDSAGGWADIRTKSIHLRVQYKPENSVLQAATEVGPVNVDLTKVISVETLYAEAPNWTPPPASNSYDEASQVPVSPSDIYSQPATLVDTPPYEYGAPAPYYWPSYYPTEPYGYPEGYSYGYPYLWWPDFGFAVVTNSGRDHHEHHDGFDGHFHRRDSRVVWNGNGIWRSRAASEPRFSGTVRLSPATSGRTFSAPAFRTEAAPSFFRAAAPAFRSEAAPAFRSEAAPAFRSAPAPSFRSGGMEFRSGGGFAHGGGFGGFSPGGGFGGGGFGGHGGGRGR